jgi:hypothetical protein
MNKDMLLKLKTAVRTLLPNTNTRHLHERLECLENEIEHLKSKLSNNPFLEHNSSLPYISPSITDRHNIGEQILWDRIDRPHYAFGLWLATIQAARLGIPKLQVYEFGVASGAGLLNLCKIAELITASTDIEFDIYGFDSDVGMPKLQDFRDHPEIWQQGQFLSDHESIRARLSANARLISGNIASTLPEFMSENVGSHTPIGFVSIDVDLYSSAKQCLPIFSHPDSTTYLPVTIAYMDDINDLLTCNQFTGEELAIIEFNENNSLRKLQEMRVRQNHPPRGWHDHIYGLHVLNHPARTGALGEGLLHNINITAL